MKQIIMLLLFVFCFSGLFSQIDPEFYSKYKIESCQTIDTHVRPSLKGTSFLDYVMSKFKDSTQWKYLEDRRELLNVNKQVMYDDSVDFIDTIGNMPIHAKFAKSTLPIKSLNDIAYERYNGESYVRSFEDRQAYGLSYKTSNVTRISQIEISVNGQQLIIPDSVFSNLFFPSFNVEFKNIKPLELYYSEKTRCFYLYVFGFDRFPTDADLDVRKVNTYFSKIVFNENRFICQITTSWGELFWYNMDCGYFIGY